MTTATLLADATRLTQRRFCGLLPPSVSDVVAAAETYQQAAQAFQATNCWSDAAAAFEHAADCYAETKDPHAWVAAKKGQIQILINNGQMEAIVDVFNLSAGKIGLTKLVAVTAPALEYTHPDLATKIYIKEATLLRGSDC
jgi:hypothetical protein